MLNQFYLSPLSGFLATDQDESSDPSYYGFTNIYGHWYIMRINAAEGTFRYANGTKDYADNWTARAGLTYGLPKDVLDEFRSQ